MLVQADFTGAHHYHLGAVGCVLNDLYCEATRLGIELDGARVRASGGLDPETWNSTGIVCEVVVATDAGAEAIERLMGAVDEVAESPKALRTGTTVVRLAR